jgi:hypothetical protein
LIYFGREVIERQLAHKETDDVRAAYNRAEYLPQRRELMEWWGGLGFFKDCRAIVYVYRALVSLLLNKRGLQFCHPNMI